MAGTEPSRRFNENYSQDMDKEILAYLLIWLIIVVFSLWVIYAQTPSNI